MALTKEKKGEVLKKVGNIINKSDSVVFVNFHGLTVADMSTMRSSLREQGVSYTVAKKTLVRKALKDSSAKGEIPTLDGELALAYLTARNAQTDSSPDFEDSDVVAPARGIFEFVKKYKENISILGGIFEGLYKNKDEMMEIAAIPPLSVLRGQFVNIINSPIQGLVVALNQIAEKKEA